MIFRWQNLPYGRKGEFCDVKGGRLKVERRQPRRPTFTVEWNGQEVAALPSIDEAKETAERLYKDGLL